MVLGIDDMDFGRDRSLVERLQHGDEEAFAELYRRHHQRLYRYCLYRLGEPHEAQDVVQEAFTRAWVKAGRLQGDLKFYPWLRTIAGNLCTDVGRRRARVQPAPEVDSGATDGGQEQIVERVDIALLEQAMSRLPDRHREVLELRETAGLTYEQLAARTGTSVGTVESLLWRARQGLKRQFAVVSGEGLLAGLPIVGWVIRRAHAAHARVVARLAGSESNYVSALSGAVGSVAIGSVVAAALVVSGGGGTSSAAPPAIQTAAPATSTGLPLLQLTAAQAGAPPSQPGPAAQTTSFVPPTTARTARTASTRMVLVSPVQAENSAAAKQEAQQDPVHLSVGEVTAGINPQAAVQYVVGLTPSHLPAP